MTTIAYRDGVLASDTATWSGAALVGSVVKIVRRPGDGHLAAAAGSARYGSAFREWFIQGEQGVAPTPMETEHYSDRGMIFRGGFVVIIHEPEGAHEIKAPYYATGSGRDFALGAMYSGAGAARAIEAAAFHDGWTQLPMTVLKHQES